MSGDLETTKVATAAKSFGEFYVPRFEVTAMGTELPEDTLRDIISITYKDNIKEIDSFDVTLGNWDSTSRRLKYVGPENAPAGSPAAPDSRRYKLFYPGAREFELKLGYGSKLTTMMRGTITSLEPSFTAGAAPTITLRVLNVLHRLQDKKRCQKWNNKKDSDIARSIKTLTDPATQRRIKVRISQAALSREQPLDYVAQENQYDIDFLLMRAYNAGYVVYVDTEQKANGKTEEFLYFGPSDEKHPVSYELEWGISLIDFKPKLSLTKQVKSVEVRSWDRQKNKAIRKKVGLNHPDIKVNRDLLPLLTQPAAQPREEVVCNEPQPTPQRAERRAVAMLSDKLKEMVTAAVTTVGLPDLRAGRRVRIKGVGQHFSGTYFVTDTTHTINDQGYTTQFNARREEVSK